VEILAIRAPSADRVATLGALDVYLRNLAISDITQKLGIGQRVRRAANAGIVVENGHQYDSDDRPGKQILGQIVQIDFLSITQ
jgi:hypothetical protein